MRRTLPRGLRYGLIGASVLLLAGVAPVAAADRHHVSMVVPTTFDGVPDPFEAHGITGCENGVVEAGPDHVEFTRAHGVYAGFKVFLCDDEESGFIVRLNARFGGGGSIGSWSIVRSWGTLAGMRGNGTLEGVDIPDGILDMYHGTVTR